ncbi:MAG: hypothetical protein JJE55_13535 [Flavobacteriaceae bacterium]|nr:hypothetical protein [Flavobacteriaceae bacterium]
MNNTNPPLPHIGNMLRTHLKKHRLFRSVLARMLGRDYAVVLKFEKKDSLQCSLLWELSMAIKHNFFADLAAQLPPDFSTDAPDPTLPFQERIAALEEENRLLNAKVETLMAVVRK